MGQGGHFRTALTAPPVALGRTDTSLTKSMVTFSLPCCTTKMDRVRLRAWSCSEGDSLSTLVSMRKTLARSSIFFCVMLGTL